MASKRDAEIEANPQNRPADEDTEQRFVRCQECGQRYLLDDKGKPEIEGDPKVCDSCGEELVLQEVVDPGPQNPAFDVTSDAKLRAQ